MTEITAPLLFKEGNEFSVAEEKGWLIISEKILKTTPPVSTTSP